VLIGINMDQHALRQAFDACLLTDDELAAGPQAWANYPDPSRSGQSTARQQTDRHSGMAATCPASITTWVCPAAPTPAGMSPFHFFAYREQNMQAPSHTQQAAPSSEMMRWR
jgi:hypothetical protein